VWPLVPYRVALVADTQSPLHAPSRFGTLVARLTGVNLLLIAAAFVTAPILARALGPSGRGEVAAVFAVVGIAPWVSELGITAFLGREHARRARPLGVLLGSTTPIALAASLVGVALAVPLAHLLGRGRPAVVEFIEIGLFLLPLSASIQLLNGVAVGDSRWNLLMLVRILSVGGTAVTIVALSLFGALSVSSVAVTYLGSAVVANVPLLVLLRGSRPWRFVRPVARTGLAFGMRSWLSTVAGTGNAYLDQVLMAGLTSSRQLGLYALAVTLSGVSGSFVGATANALFPRVAVGDSQLAARACRVTLAFVILLGVGIAVTSPWVVPFVFGKAFDDAIPMLVILLGASVFSVPSQVLSSALVAAGNPSATAGGQIVGLVVTVPALIVVIPFAGGIGASWVSLAAYAVTFAIILRASAQTFALPFRTLLVVTPADLRWLRARLRRHDTESQGVQHRSS
jgi:O-antigen/teichoic acid export membrane protein